MQPKRQPPRGFFIIWGSRNRISPDGTGSLQAVCPSCQRLSRLDGMKLQNWFTLYWIPIFPTGKGQRFTQCATCKAQFRGNLDEMRQTLATQASRAGPVTAGGGPPPMPGFPAAIALFNSMRETPEDSAKLAQLLQMYLNMNEPGEAVSAGRAYPNAMEVSDVCCSLMSQAFLRLGDREAAARHAAAALALNPNNGGAMTLQGQAQATG